MDPRRAKALTAARQADSLLLAGVFFAALVAFPNCGAVASAADAVSGPEVELLGTTGDCPSDLHLVGTPGEAPLLDFSGFEARADAATTRVRRFCAVRLKVNVPAGLEALVGVPEIAGAATLSPQGSGTLSVRWYEAGAAGDAWLKRLVAVPPEDPAGSPDTAPVSTPFAETPADWKARWHGCGASPELTLMIDVTARVRLAPDDSGNSGDVTPLSQITVQHFQLPGVLYRRCAADRA